VTDFDFSDLSTIRDEVQRRDIHQAVDLAMRPRAQSRLPVVTLPWAQPLLQPRRFKGAKGGRSSGRSHHFAQQMVVEMHNDPDAKAVCLREVQRSLEYSAKTLIENKIRELGVEHEFRIMAQKIERRGGHGVMLFLGMQDRTADNIRSLEGFKFAWFEEAHNLSQRSLELLIPTIRMDDSEIWFSWNPENDTDPIDSFLIPLAKAEPDEAIVIHSTYLDNPLCPDRAKKDAATLQRVDPDAYNHIWLGGYNTVPDAIVLHGKWERSDFTASGSWDGPYYGADWGFSQDPTVLVRCWIGDNRLWIDHEARGVGVSLDDTPALFDQVPGARTHKIRADSARPETINHVNERGFDVIPAKKWSGSPMDGVAVLRSFEKIVIHPRCSGLIDEARTWSYKTDRLTKDPKPELKDGNDHGWDAIRYALDPIIRVVKPGPVVRAWYPGMHEPAETEDERTARLVREAVAKVREAVAKVREEAGVA